MKLSALVCCVLLVMALPVHAQEDSVQHMRPEISAYAGLSIPYLPLEFREFWKLGGHFGAGYGYSFTPGPIGYGAVNATVEYGRFVFNPTAYVDSMIAPYDPNNITPGADNLKKGAWSSATISTFNVSVNFKGCFSKVASGVISPYFLLGIGYMYYSAEDVKMDTLQEFRINGTKSGCVSWSGGLGVEVCWSDNLSTFWQIRSQLGVIEKTRQFFPIDMGVRLRL
jgi:outer membrane autotransporter protein